MKRWFLLFFFNVILTVAGCLLCNYNRSLKEHIKDFKQDQEYFKKLLKKNDELKYPWPMKNFDVVNFLSSNLNVHVLCDEVIKGSSGKLCRPNVIFSKGYISGYLWCEDCYLALKSLAEQSLPLWIKSLSLNRDIYENYNLQFSMTYEVGKIQKD